MFSWLLTAAINSLRRFAVAVKCPKCGHKFVPFGEEPMKHWREIMGRFPCPKCGYLFGIGEDASLVKNNPPGPFDQPQDSRIERHVAPNDSLIFYLPPSGHWGGLLLFALVWNVFILPIFYIDIVQHRMFPSSVTGPHVIISVFAAAGVIMLYSTFHQRFASYLIYLGPDEFKVRRSFIFPWSNSLPTQAIESVWREVAYTNTGGTQGRRTTTRTFTIEVRAGLKILRFGSALMPDEQHWLAWEIRRYLREHGAEGLCVEVPENRRLS